MCAARRVVPSNLLLAALARPTYRRISRDLETVRLDLNTLLAQPGELAPFVYFPADALISLIALTDDSGNLEVGLVGRDGMMGSWIALGARNSPVRAVVQVAGNALRMRSSTFARELDDNTPLREAALRHAHLAMVTAMQIAACNARHRLGARLARWLLMTAERLRTKRFALTQDFVAQMLGTRRATVNSAAGALQRKGLINYSRGVIKIVDAEGLGVVACSCHERIRALTATS